MTTSPAVKLTYDDFIHFPDDGRHELMDGSHQNAHSTNATA